MGDLALRVENLGKMYHIGAQRQRQETWGKRMAETVSGGLRRIISPRVARSGSSRTETLWALRNVSFELRRGDVLGIVGENGSGKSTLLKILSRITAPTEGQAELYGQVGSLLEVGVGFHPDLTGRENIYLNGSILGMKKSEIDKIFDGIVDFSGVEKFIDTPVKRYSSGMHVRLAFAVAAHFNPDILILDEVLAVGDVAFQRKSLKRIESASRSGKTVLFVSHGMANVSRLCNKGIFLQHGIVKHYGTANETIAAYLKTIHSLDEPEYERELAPWLDLKDAKRWEGNKRNIFKWISTQDGKGQPTARFESGQTMRIRLGFQVDEPVNNAYCQINFLDHNATRVMELKTTYADTPLRLEGSGVIECVIPDLRLVSGEYVIMIETGDMDAWQFLDCVPNALRVACRVGKYLAGSDLVQGQVYFAQQSSWDILPYDSSQGVPQS